MYQLLKIGHWKQTLGQTLSVRSLSICTMFRGVRQNKHWDKYWAFVRSVFVHCLLMQLHCATKGFVHICSIRIFMPNAHFQDLIHHHHHATHIYLPLVIHHLGACTHRLLSYPWSSYHDIIIRSASIMCVTLISSFFIPTDWKCSSQHSCVRFWKAETTFWRYIELQCISYPF